MRVGLACGPVLLRDGDYFGPTVNLAHRIVNIGNPGTVLITDEFHTALLEAAPDEFTASRCGPALLKDLGRVQLWWCAAPARGRRDRGGGGPAPQRALGAAVRGAARPRGAARGRRAAAHRAIARAGSVGAQPGGGDAEGRRANEPSKGSAGSPAGRPAIPSGPAMVTVVGSGVGLKTRTSSTPATAAHGGDLGAVDLSAVPEAGRSPPPEGGDDLEGQEDVVGQRVGIVDADGQGVARASTRRPAICRPSTGVRGPAGKGR